MRRLARIAYLIIASFAVVAAGAGQALAQKRVAFVVGIDRYDNLGSDQQLQRAVSDAKSVGAALKSLGFDVIAAENLARGAFNEQFQKFLDKLAPGDTAALYYAGHGVEIEGSNFLLPRDVPNIRFGRQEQIKRESLSVAEIQLDLRNRNPEIMLVILDACRDNPLVPPEQRSAGIRGGLAPLKGEPPKGSFIIYSAGAGETALDRLPGSDPDRVNSIFTRKLLPLLGKRGLALHDLARQLRADVLELASTVPHTQRPAYYDGVIGRYCLAGCEGATEAPKRAEPSATSHRRSEAAETWSTTKDTTSTAILEAFINRYGDTGYADLAKARIEELKVQRATDLAQQAVERKRAEDAARKRSEDDARAKADAERQRLAMLQQDENRNRAEAEAQKKRAGAGGWAEMGCQQISLAGKDRDHIRLGRREDLFKAIRLHVRGNDVEVINLRVVFTSGGPPDDIQIRQVIRAGDRTRPLDLSGWERSLDQVEIVWRTVPNFKGLATVCIEGLP